MPGVFSQVLPSVCCSAGATWRGMAQWDHLGWNPEPGPQSFRVFCRFQDAVFFFRELDHGFNKNTCRTSHVTFLEHWLGVILINTFFLSTTKTAIEPSCDTRLKLGKQNDDCFNMFAGLYSASTCLLGGSPFLPPRLWLGHTCKSAGLTQGALRGPQLVDWRSARQPGTERNPSFGGNCMGTIGCRLDWYFHGETYDLIIILGAKFCRNDLTFKKKFCVTTFYPPSFKIFRIFDIPCVFFWGANLPPALAIRNQQVFPDAKMKFVAAHVHSELGRPW